MKKKRIYLIIALGILMMISACGQKQDDAKSLDQLYDELGIPVRTQEMVLTNFEQYLRYNAALSGIKETSTQAMLSDVVTEIKVKIGDRVEKDDIILTFPENSPSAQYQQAKTAFESIEAIHERMSRLKDQGAISQQDFDNVDTQYKVAKANLASSEQMIFVRAPISGVVTNIMVNTSDRTYPGQDLFTISSTDGYKATIMVPESEISRIKKGATVRANWGDVSINGRVTEIAMAMDPMRKAFRVEATFPGFRRDLNFGVTAELGMLVESKKNVFVLDRENIVRQNGESYVWLADDGIAKKAKVGLGLSDLLRYEVTEGLSDGDMVITEGLRSLSEGVKIRIIEDR
ncbi:MAG: efflux RND transporter periplasmic adaptor subunit [Candidatus Cloacimonadaceae bacterium]